MKKPILFLLLLLFTIVTEAQKIHYVSSLEEAKTMALQQHKPVAILITMQSPAAPPDFMKGLDDKNVIEKFNSNFINYKLEREDTAASRKIITAYKVYRFPGFIFLDAKGALLFTDIAFVSRPASLLDVADKALAATKGKSLFDYDSVYATGTHTPGFLKEYISKRMGAGITDNANLIEQYVEGIAVTDVNSYAEVLFILKAGPLADSTAYKLATTNRAVVDSIFKKEPLSVRVAMNNATIANTMASAIATKNSRRAMAAANFTRTTWSSNYTEGQKNWNLKMMQYYGAVKDTVSYLGSAVAFYEQYYMRMSTDSVRKKDSLDFELAKNKARESAVPVPGDTARRKMSSFSFPKNSYASELNNAAWSFYQMAGNNNDYLLKAMLWSKRSVELNPASAAYDTYAHLLYRLKFFKEAESMEENAIETGKAEKADIKLYQEEYKKIKNKNL